jgi:hypothetical protein
MSLSGVASPHATESKTRTLDAPYCAAIRGIASRLSTSKSLILSPARAAIAVSGYPQYLIAGRAAKLDFAHLN